jgi:hypothetical protein
MLEREPGKKHWKYEVGAALVFTALALAACDEADTITQPLDNSEAQPTQGEVTEDLLTPVAKVTQETPFETPTQEQLPIDTFDDFGQEEGSFTTIDEVKAYLNEKITKNESFWAIPATEQEIIDIGGDPLPLGNALDVEITESGKDIRKQLFRSPDGAGWVYSLTSANDLLNTPFWSEVDGIFQPHQNVYPEDEEGRVQTNRWELLKAPPQLNEDQIYSKVPVFVEGLPFYPVMEGDKIVGLLDQSTMTISEYEMPTVPTEEPSLISINPGDPYKFDSTIGLEEIASASDGRLVEIAPSFSEGFDYTKLGFKQGEVETLTKSGEAATIGDNKLVPYLDQNGEVIMGWDVEKGEMVHLGKSVYTDEQTGITINSYVYTDNEWARDNNTWWELDELSEGDLSEAFFDYPLALNYMWAYHNKEFVERLRLKYWQDIDSFWSQFYHVLSGEEIKSYQTRALQLFRQEINGRIAGGEETKIRLGRMGDLGITEKNIDVLYKMNYSSNYSKRSHSNAPFGDMGHVSAELEGINDVVININIDRWHKNNRMIHFVGSPIQHALFGITAGGHSLAWYSENTKDAWKSFGDLIMFQTCGEEVIENYLSKLQGDFAEEGAVPKVDWVNSKFPTCTVSERRSSGN